MCLSSQSFEWSMTCVSGAIAFASWPSSTCEARERQLRLIGIRRSREILDQAVGDLPRLGAIVVLKRGRHVVELRSRLQSRARFDDPS